MRMLACNDKAILYAQSDAVCQVSSPPVLERRLRFIVRPYRDVLLCADYRDLLASLYTSPSVVHGLLI